MMTKATKNALPAHSSLHDRKQRRDFLDCYSIESNISAREAAEIVVDFPDWAQFLVKVRNLLTAPFGLATDKSTQREKLGIFPVELETPDELIAGFNDKHLDFRVTVLSHEGRIYVATWVHPHNIGGRLYLKTILPFHILIVKDALQRVASESPKA